MKYNLADFDEEQMAYAYMQRLAAKGAIVNISKVNPNRTLSQNSYLHLLLADFGGHFGYNLEEAKQVYKELNPDLYKYVKKGRTFWRSSAELDKDQMAKSIDRLMQASAKHGHPLPPATDQGWLREVEREAEQMERYL